jgi:hypothetical protein
MHTLDLLTQNLAALRRSNPRLAGQIAATQIAAHQYEFLQVRSGQTIPAWRDTAGTLRPLHSQIDPKREAIRLLGQTHETKAGFFILLGLGGGFAAAEALARPDTERVLVIDYDMGSVAELLAAIDYTTILDDARCLLCIDAEATLIKQTILEHYQPVLAGGIRVLPLRTRTEVVDGNGVTAALFNTALKAIEHAIDLVSGDYSVQAFFGMRWFSNIIHNVFLLEEPQAALPAVKQVSICGAGPSLDAQFPRLAENRRDTFLIATDTSLPAVLQAGMTPDAVVSIDCQHISYSHFMMGLPCPLYLDLASPPRVASCSPHPRFFSGGHPLTRYIAQYWRHLPEIDTSGGNVTYAAMVLAERMGAETIELYGADFAYPMGRSYARGSYMYPSFERRQTRLTPYETLSTALLFRGSAQKRVKRDGYWYYEPPLLAMYRNRLERKIETLRAAVIPIAGKGASITIKQTRLLVASSSFAMRERPRSARVFLAEYRASIEALPSLRVHPYLEHLELEARQVFTTLLPLAAAIKRRNPAFDTNTVIEETRVVAMRVINRVMDA